jgi:hypothetical protein
MEPTIVMWFVNPCGELCRHNFYGHIHAMKESNRISEEYQYVFGYVTWLEYVSWLRVVHSV